MSKQKDIQQLHETLDEFRIRHGMTELRAQVEEYLDDNDDDDDDDDDDFDDFNVACGDEEEY